MIKWFKDFLCSIGMHWGVPTPVSGILLNTCSNCGKVCGGTDK